MLSSMIDKEFRHEKVVIQQSEHLEMEAQLAVAFIERWGLVCAIPDGEDAAGRQKMRLSTSSEIVDRAFEIAALTMDTARAKNLVHACPVLEPAAKVAAKD